jgi:hypothetical protein
MTTFTRWGYTPIVDVDDADAESTLVAIGTPVSNDSDGAPTCGLTKAMMRRRGANGSLVQIAVLVS